MEQNIIKKEVIGFEMNFTVGPQFKYYSLKNYLEIPQMEKLTDEQKFDIEVVGQVLPFKANNYVVDELINWDDAPNDPIYALTFPQKGMLKPEYFDRISALLKSGASRSEIKSAADSIRLELSPHPAGQLKYNRPSVKGEPLKGAQHKYTETVLFFPSQGQTCHAYCTYCFRWAQFTGMSDLKIAMKEIEPLIEYIRQRPHITDILFTGGDPMFMPVKFLKLYIEALLDADLPHLQNIRIGTKALAYWPYRFLTDEDSQEVLDLFKKVNDSGKHLALMAHFTHIREMQTDAVKEAILRIRETGAQIRTQSPVIAHVNDDPKVWADMWREQVRLGCVPYYFFVARNTGAQHFFGVTLEKAWEIFQKAYQDVSGLGRTVRGPVMSAYPGKVRVLGVNEIAGEKVFVLESLQNRNDDKVLRPFFAKYNPDALWFTDLEPYSESDKIYFDVIKL
ncbi:MAG: hypothetical protein JEZ06_12270 [Anaerolineaceae bacterium]|nr:hypothetical protein [Anaerolineaceae bacterium]